VGASEAPVVAVCMATYNPDPVLFAQQIRSLRDQLFTDWTCYVSDDCSDPAGFTTVIGETRGDPRFMVDRSPERLGVYRNFERALGMVPDRARLVALADQDDSWYPEKLQVLVEACESGADLVYSDFHVADQDGRILAPTFWTNRRNYWDRFDLLAVLNTVTGAAAMFPRSLLDDALPFPPMPDPAWHDHWLTLVAVARGRLAYVDKALYAYVRHASNVTGGNYDVRPRRELRLQGPRTAYGNMLGAWKAQYEGGVRYTEHMAEQAHLRLGHRVGQPRQVDRIRRLSSSTSSLLWVMRLALRPIRDEDPVTPIRARNLLRGIAYWKAARIRMWLRSTPPDVPPASVWLVR